MKQNNKKKTIIVFITIGIFLIILFGGVMKRSPFSNDVSANEDQVRTAVVYRGSIDESIETTGTVDALEIKVFHASVSTTIDDVYVRVGDVVKSGEPLISYDQEELSQVIEMAKLKDLESAGQYNDTVERAYDPVKRYGFEGMSIQDMEKVIDEINTMVDELTEKIREKKHRIAQTRNELQIVSIDPDQNGEVGDQSGDEERQLRIQEAIQEYSVAEELDAEIATWNRNIEELRVLQGKLSEAKDSMITSGAKNALDASRKLSQITNGATVEDYETAKEGINAENDGIITKIHVRQGDSVNSGMDLIEMTADEDLVVRVNLTKYELSKVEVGQKVKMEILGIAYNGLIQSVSHVGALNENGGMVFEAIVSFDKTDDLYIGVEANAEIMLFQQDDALIVPTEAVNTDVDGTFVYVIEEGVLVRKDITCGVASDGLQEILDGLSVGERILLSVNADTRVGDKVVVD